ncbi:hypothetical protein VDGD_21377 [Verticillium dahliae]|nr:hypothetical protein VDGD_21377 [Verticillium dahliae]
MQLGRQPARHRQRQWVQRTQRSINFSIQVLHSALWPRYEHGLSSSQCSGGPPLLAVVIRNQEGQLQRLLLVQSRVAEARVVGRQIVLVEVLAAAEALGHGVARELEMHAAEEAALLLVDLQRLLQLLENVAKLARLDAAARRLRVAVHGIALPDDALPVLAVLDGADVRRQ